MNIYDFIPSPDVAAHCRNIGHQFSPLDMAVLIAISDKSLQERHDAWREVISGYPDMPIHESLNFEAQSSLHEYLRDLLSREEKLLADFLAPGDGVVYQASILANRWGHKQVDGCFPIFEDAFQNIEKRWDWEEDGLESGDIRREVIGCPDKWQSAKVSRHGEITSLARLRSDDDPDELDMIFIHIPIPFEKGDIVAVDEMPGVLYRMVHWHDGYEDFVTGKRGDGSDNVGGCYLLGEDGSLTWDHGPPLMTHRLRKYTDELKGQERFLAYLSHYIKTEDHSVDWLIAAWSRFYTEAQYQKELKHFSSCYLPLEKLRGNG